MGFDPTITATVMYAPWSDWRGENAHELYDQLSASDFIDHASLHPNQKARTVWEDARECWLEGVEHGSTHHIVIQGDVELCEGFGEAAYNAVSAVPNRNIGFYGTHKRLAEAFEDGKRWYKYDGGLWGQASCLLTDHIQSMVAFGDTYFEADVPHDDTRLAAWSELALPQATWMALPQLVEHLGAEDSEMNHQTPTDWTAATYVGDTDLDAREIDWTERTDVPSYAGERQVNQRPSIFCIEELVADGYIEEAQ